MFEIILIGATVTLMLVFRNSSKNATVYSGQESHLGEANKYYWLLKNSKIPVKFQMPFRRENFYRFGYKESPIYIKVSQKDVDKARQIMLDYRMGKIKMASNMEAEKRK